MGELSTQIMTGGPDVVPLSEHQTIVGVMSTRLTGWEMYRARETIRRHYFKAMSRDAHLHTWARIEGLGGVGHEDLSEDNARALAGIIAGEWGVGKALGKSVADGIREYAAKLSPTMAADCVAATAALVRLADRYAPV